MNRAERCRRLIFSEFFLVVTIYGVNFADGNKLIAL